MKDCFFFMICKVKSDQRVSKLSDFVKKNIFFHQTFPAMNLYKSDVLTHEFTGMWVNKY